MLPSNIQDTTHLLLRLKEVANLPEGTLLVTLDVKALYPNINISEALKAAKHTLDKHRLDSHPVSNNDIVRLLSLVLRCNNFECNDSHYLQIQGVAMGTKAAPTIANLFMGEFEDEHVYPYHLSILLWLRFIDDILMLWTHGLEELMTFIDHLNSVHRTIKFTANWSYIKMNVLDILIYVKPNGTLGTKLYIKPTDTHMYLHYSSCHPKNQKTSGPYSQLVRIRRICSEDSDFESTAKNILSHYKSRGYPAPILAEALNKASALNRDTLQARRLQQERGQDDRLFCIITYHPRNPPILDILNKNHHILQTTPHLQCIANKQIMIGQRRNKNLKDLIVHSRIRYPSNAGSMNPTGWINPTKVCNNTNCRICPHLDKSGRAISATTNLRYIIPQRISCMFNNIIYLISCKQCGLQYVGQTKRALKVRFSEHFRDIRHATTPAMAPPSVLNKGFTRVGKHFSHSSHSYLDVTIQILEFIKRNPTQESTTIFRKARERYWMYRLRTLEPLGINSMDDVKNSLAAEEQFQSSN
jgi:hypothetical protein